MGNIIEMYKIVKGNEGIEWVKPPRLRSDLKLEEFKESLFNHGTGTVFRMQ